MVTFSAYIVPANNWNVTAVEHPSLENRKFIFFAFSYFLWTESHLQVTCFCVIHNREELQQILRLFIDISFDDLSKKVYIKVKKIELKVSE